MHILFVDDTPETRNIFRLCFEFEGHTVETAHNGPQALRIIEEQSKSIDLLILDYNMPQMNGVEVVKRLRQREDLPFMPVILFSSGAKGELETLADELKVARVVYKPIMPTDMIALAQEVVNRA